MKKLWPALALGLTCCALIAPVLRAETKAAPTKAESWPIITRKGNQIFEGDKPFRFFGLAAPNIQAHESQLLPDFSNHFPDEYEIRDLFSAMKRMGCRATRTFSLSVTHPDDKGLPAYVMGRHVYNEEAFKCLDRVLALAHEYDIRLIIPFIASQSFNNVRGVDEFALLSGKPGPSFWTDEDVKSDFKHYLDFILNRKNTVSGVLYKDDPAILAWQLGNEFGSYPYDRKMNPAPWDGIILRWSKEMAAHIKQVDPFHLIAEAGGCDRNALVEDPNIDLISTHLYEYWCRWGAPKEKNCDLDKLALADLADCKGKKPLLVDEFGLGTTQGQKNLMDVILREQGIVGGLLWSLRSHRRDGGWFYHNEGGTSVNSFHYPGFSAGFVYDETRVLDQLRNYAYAIRGLAVPRMEKPSPAPLLKRQGEGFTWRGSTGASSYTMERADNPKGPWKPVAINLEDSVVSDVKTFEPSPEASFPTVLWYDESAQPGKSFYYRVKGVNLAGETEYSNVLDINGTAKAAK